MPRDRPGFRLGSERRSTDPQSGKESPTKPVSRPVCGQERREHVGEWSEGQKEEKHRFFSPIPADFRRIYFKAAGYEFVNRCERKSSEKKTGMRWIHVSESNDS